MNPFAKLFENLFGKRKAPVATAAQPSAVPAPDDLETLIGRAADTLTSADQQRALDALQGVTLYINLHRDAEGRTRMPSAAIGNGIQAIVLYIAPDHPELVKPFGSLLWEKALDMVGTMPENAGLLVQSRGTGWIAIDRKGATAIRAQG